MSEANKPNRARMVLVALILLSGAYWAGARYSARQPLKVEAVPAPTPSGSPDQLPISAVPVSTAAQRDAALTDDESINVRVYRQASPAVANVLTKATEYDFFMDPVPVE